MAIVHSQRVGPIRVSVNAQGAALSLFKKGERNEIIKAAMAQGGRFWIDKFMMKRFSMYAYAVLGYRASARWRATKQRYLGQAVPFVGFTPTNGGSPPTWKKGKNTEKMMNAVKRARVEGRSRGDKFSALIFVPFGHAIPAEKSANFRTIPAHEIGAISGEVARALAHFLWYGIDKSSNIATKQVEGRTMIGATSQWSRGLDPSGRSVGPSPSRGVG
jgi:hypothetical protein